MVIGQQLPASSLRRGKRHLDRGAVAVEMALVSPLLVAMMIGIIDFSRVFNAELQLSQAAREGARLASLLPNPTAADLTAIQTRAQLAAPNPAFGAPLPLSGVVPLTPYCTSTPAATDVAKVRVDYVFNGIFWLKGATLTQTAVMRCAG